MKHLKRLGRGSVFVAVLIGVPMIVVYIIHEVLSGNEVVTIITVLSIFLGISYLLGIENTNVENRSVGRKPMHSKSSLAAGLEVEEYQLVKSDKYEEVYVKEIDGTPHYVTLKKEN